MQSEKYIQRGVNGFFSGILVLLIGLGVSQSVSAETYYFHNDHLGTPQVVTDDAQAVVWKGEYDPFGEVTETVSAVEQNLRFPGQYYDQETGLHYNYFRTYDPGTGRYVESDPIGLGGGLSTYGYTMGNPLRYVDPFGLDVYMCWGFIRTYPHARICVDDNCGGLMPDGLCPGGGMVDSEEFDKNQCTMIEESDACDQNVYEQCLTEAINNRSCTGYNIFTNNCIHWGNDTLNRCAELACSK